MIKNLNEIKPTRIAIDGAPIRPTGNVAEASAVIGAEEASLFVSEIGADALRQLEAEGYAGHLKAMQRKTWGGALREAKERLGMSWAAFDAHILAARSIIWPEIFGKR